MALVVKLRAGQDRAVAVIAAQNGTSKAEVIQDAVDFYLRHYLVVGDKKE
jgi:hypothetical protein